MTKANCVIDEETEKKRLQKEQILTIEAHLARLKYAAKTNDEKLWKSAESSFMNVLYNNKHGGLHSLIKSKYLREYHKIVPEGDFFKLEEDSSSRLKLPSECGSGSNVILEKSCYERTPKKCYLNISDFESSWYDNKWYDKD